MQPASQQSPVANTAAAPASPAPVSTAPATSDTTRPFEWRVHSAKDVISGGGAGIWPWLAGLAFLFGAAGMLLAQQVMRRRNAQAAEAEWEASAEEAPAPAIARTAATIPSTAVPVAAVRAPEQEPPVLDLLTIMAEPEAERLPKSLSDAGAPDAAAQQTRPALGLVVNPLDVVLSARRLSATLMNTVLNYELTVSNNGREPIGPIIIGGDMIGAHASLPDRTQLELGGREISPLHRHASIAPGESVTLTGEFKLPLSAITPIRSGNAALFIPLARFRVEAMRNGAPPLVVARTFVVGENQDRPGAALKPFRLDLGPRLYSHIGQRELALSA